MTRGAAARKSTGLRRIAGRRSFLARWLPVAVSAAAFLIGWKLLVVVGGYPPYILPPPETVFQRLARGLAQGTIPPHALATLEEIGWGFLVGAGAALVIGYLLARSPLAEKLVSPYLVAAQATPILAIAPLLALWFGTGLISKVIICALIVFFPVAVATMVGIRSVDARLLELGQSLRATRWQVFRHLELPAALPSILGGMRVGVTLAVIGAIVGEWAGADRGLGVLILLAQGSLFDIPLLFATLATIAFIGLGLYIVVLLVERQLIGRWR
jgi:NitT/TauT family transport system permease protein